MSLIQLKWFEDDYQDIELQKVTTKFNTFPNITLQSKNMPKLCIIKKNKIYLIWSLFRSQSAPIKQECNRIQLYRLTITVCSHEFTQLGASFDPEEHLITILQHTKMLQIIIPDKWKRMQHTFKMHTGFFILFSSRQLKQQNYSP